MLLALPGWVCGSRVVQVPRSGRQPLQDVRDNHASAFEVKEWCEEKVAKLEMQLTHVQAELAGEEIHTSPSFPSSFSLCGSAMLTPRTPAQQRANRNLHLLLASIIDVHCRQQHEPAPSMLEPNHPLKRDLALGFCIGDLPQNF